MTREEAATILYKEWQRFLEDNLDYAGISDAYTMAIKALEEQSVLDKIRAEIMAIGNWRFEYEIPNSDMREVLKIIDKHTSGGDSE